MSPVLVDSSAVVSAVLERGLPRSTAQALSKSSALIVSRLALVETARALRRARAESRISDKGFAKAEQDVMEFWSRCEIWELTRQICTEAMTLAPDTALRTLDAIHLATALVARKRFPRVRLLTMDTRMRDAAVSLGIQMIRT
jgi:predicted nucleic acid-binding protein